MKAQYLEETRLKKEIINILSKQGYCVQNGKFELRKDDREAKRQAHLLAKAERILVQEDFIIKNIPLVNSYLKNGSEIDIDKIEPKLIEVKADTKWEILFRWWSLVWWSLPNERSYGRQMRFIIFDKHNQSLIGLIGLQSPILSWSVRDSFLSIEPKNRDYWVNQSLSAQRLGALPPYNQILGGKLVASLVTSDPIRNAFKRKYSNVKTILQKRKIPARLLFITTTGAYGKSSIYSRLKYQGVEIAKFIGFSQGVGSFHIPNKLYEELVSYLETKDVDTRRGYGSGPSRKLRLIEQAMGFLGFEKGTKHNIQRGVYLFPLVNNLHKVISHNTRPRWIKRTVLDLTDYWKKRWAIPRSQRDKSYLSFEKNLFIESAKKELRDFKDVYKNIIHG